MKSANLEFNVHEITTRLGVSLEELVIMGAYAYEECRHEMGRKVGGIFIRKALRTGAKVLAEEEKSVTFRHAVEESLRLKEHRRPNTLREIKSFMARVMREKKGIAERFMSSFSTQEWQGIIDEVFSTPLQRKKARVLLHGVFAIAYKRGWCRKNPLENVDIPVIQEKQIHVLTISECEELMDVVQGDAFRDCLVPVSLMLYAGVRPHEVERLTWRNIDLEERTILLSPYQTKTGGGRKITIEDVLFQLLVKEYRRMGVVDTQEGGVRRNKNGEKSRESREDVHFLEGVGNVEKAANRKIERHIETLVNRNRVCDLGEINNREEDSHRICPRNWERRWKDLRYCLGWSVAGVKGRAWVPDVLRHTYASYHALYYKDYKRLQYEMGHRSAYLLQMRYINMDRLSRRDVSLFWKKPA